MILINGVRSWRYFTANCVTVARKASRVFPNVYRSCWLSCSRAWFLCEMRRGENWNWAPRISYTHRQLQIRSGPIQHSLWAAGLHRNRGMSRRIGRASFACCRARRVDKLTTISMRYHLDEICLHWREMMVNVLSGARRRSIVVVLVVAIVVVVVA